MYNKCVNGTVLFRCRSTNRPVTPALGNGADRESSMKDLLEKLSSYNIFNYLLPGVVFVAISSSLTGYSLIQDDIVIGVFLYYFIGLVISRIGSILVEPVLKGLGFLHFSEYRDYSGCQKR